MVDELQTRIPDHNRPVPAQEHKATNTTELDTSVSLNKNIKQYIGLHQRTSCFIC